ncbi:MNN4 protein [Actinomycetales bacterium JB111]|nr:MNN4 protein [Actinomycetales bacterium JB111]
MLPAMPDRLATRRRLLAWSSPLVALGLIGGPFLLGLAFADDRHRDQASDDPAGAIEGFAALADDTRFGPATWVSVYNGGTSALLADQPGVAVTELTRALALVPEGTTDEDGEVDPDLPECLVRRNLSLSHETLAVDSAEQQDYDQVTVHLTDALEALGACTTEPPDLPEPPESQSESESEDQPESPTESESEPPTDGDGGEEESSEQQSGEQESSDQESGDGQDEQQNPNDEIQERQEQRMEENREAQEQEQQSGEDESESESGDGGDEEETTSLTPQEEELQSRNREAEQDQRDQEQRSGGGYGGGQNW